nr:ABC transporter permease [Streptomyces vietnamensis]
MRDLLAEAFAGILQRPGRATLTALGTVLGVGTFVAVLGLTATASSQIDARFNVLTATEVTVEDVARTKDPFAAPGFPEDAGPRVERLRGVRHAGVFWPVRPPTGAPTVRSSPVSDAAGTGGANIEVTAVSPGALQAVMPRLAEGRLYDAYHAKARQPVAVIGSGIAARLGISTLETSPTLFIGDQPFTVAGVIDDVRRRPEMLMSVLVPDTVARGLWGEPTQDSRMIVATDLGAAPQIAAEIPVALRPDHPDYLQAAAPPDPRTLRSSVTSDLDQLFLLLAAICLFIGAVGIANTTLVSVLERTGEIGLRRALGARGRHVTAQFLTESGFLGALGGLVGTSIGSVTVVLVAWLRDWTPVLHTGTVVAAPLIGLVTGVVAGIYPAWRAARIQPVEALRR